MPSYKLNPNKFFSDDNLLLTNIGTSGRIVSLSGKFGTLQKKGRKKRPPYTVEYHKPTQADLKWLYENGHPDIVIDDEPKAATASTQAKAEDKSGK